MKTFEEFKIVESRAKLLSVIVSKTGGKLSKEELESIVNAVNFDNKYDIEVISDADMLAEKLMLIDYKQATRCGNSKVKLYNGSIVFGECQFGRHNVYDHYKEEKSKEKKVAATFQPDKKIAFILKKHKLTIVDNSNAYDKCEFEIVIYIPKSYVHEMSEEVKYILENFKKAKGE